MNHRVEGIWVLEDLMQKARIGPRGRCHAPEAHQFAPWPVPVELPPKALHRGMLKDHPREHGVPQGRHGIIIPPASAGVF
jgi:hypothetical protein